MPIINIQNALLWSEFQFGLKKRIKFLRDNRKYCTFRKHHNHNNQPGASTSFQRERQLELAFSPYVPFSAVDLAKHLSQNVIYHKQGDVLAIEKPYGISCLGYIQKGHGIFGYSRQDYERRESQEYNERKVDLPTIEDALPYLKKHFHEPGLHFCMGLKRWVSGPIILPCSTRAFNRICHSVYEGNSIACNTKNAQAQHMFRALAICISRPRLDKGTVVGYSTFQKTAQASEYIFVEGTIPKRARNANLAAQGEISYNVLASNYGLSLVDLHFSKFTKHFPRVFLFHLGAPIFCDWIYTQRLIDIDGKPTLIEPKDISRGGKKYEPVQFLQILGVNQSNELKYGPTTQHLLFLAVYQTTLPFWGDTKRERALTELKLIIPPPEHFLEMANMLNFTPKIKHLLDSLYMENRDNVADVEPEPARS